MCRSAACLLTCPPLDSFFVQVDCSMLVCSHMLFGTSAREMRSEVAQRRSIPTRRWSAAFSALGGSAGNSGPSTARASPSAAAMTRVRMGTPTSGAARRSGSDGEMRASAGLAGSSRRRRTSTMVVPSPAAVQVALQLRENVGAYRDLDAERVIDDMGRDGDANRGRD